MSNIGENDMEKGWTTKNENNKRIHQLWRNMIMRCYDITYLEKCPSYKNVSICDQWLKLSNFVEDIKNLENYDLWLKNKIYSPETCKFVSHKENCIQRSNENIVSEETRKKLSKINSGENNPMFGINHSDETKQKMSEARTGEKHPLYGKHHSDETKKKLSESRKGKGCVEVVMVDSDNNTSIFSSAVEAAEYLSKKLNCKIYSSNITKTCAYYNNPEKFIDKYGKAQKSYKGFKFYYVEDYKGECN